MNRNAPVIFFSLGKCQKFHPVLKESLDFFGVKDAGHIEVPQDFSDVMLKREIERVWRDFLQTGIRADVLRANFFIYVDETALALPKLIVAAEKYFAALYPAGVLTDVYCLTDDANLLENADFRRDVFYMLDEIQGDNVQVYLLSNLSSKNAFLPEETAAQTAALLTLFKNYSSNLRAGAADASRYNERVFLENCHSRNGKFLTAGSVILSVPLEAIGALISAEILMYRRDFSDEPEDLPAPNFPAKRPAKSMDYLYGVAIPDANYADPLTRGQWVSRLFGERLERIASEHDETEYDGEEIFPTINFHSLLRATSESGIFYKSASEAAEAALAELKKTCDRHESWLNARPDMKTESPSRRLSPMKSQNLFPYALASEFLKKKMELQFIDEKIKIFEKRVRLIAKFHKKLLRSEEEINKAVAAYNEKFSHIETIFHQGAADYFRKKFAAYVAENKPEIEKLSGEMSDALRSGEFLDFKKRLDAFVEKNVLTAPQFALPVEDVLREMGEIPATTVADWAASCRHMSVRLKTGSAQLYTETNLYVPEAATGLEVKKICEARGLGRLNLFTDENAACVAVLYHAGAFDASEMYYLVGDSVGDSVGDFDEE
ncbi:MAG: hypothetical protein FWF77_03080 [Defluviitaleaceae bacterium]|nr:hypothetical protein [Defluviitaleaceae bacterium]